MVIQLKFSAGKISLDSVQFVVNVFGSIFLYFVWL